MPAFSRWLQVREIFLFHFRILAFSALHHNNNFSIDYKKKIGFTGQLLIEPKPKEPTKHQYDYDAMTVMGFLKTYGLEGDFKLNVEPNHTTLAGHGYEHDVAVAARY